MDEIYNKGFENGLKAITSIFELSYEIDNMYFVLGFFTTEKEARYNFELVKKNKEYCQEGAEILQIREYNINDIEFDKLEPKRIVEQIKLDDF